MEWNDQWISVQFISVAVNTRLRHSDIATEMNWTARTYFSSVQFSRFVQLLHFSWVHLCCFVQFLDATELNEFYAGSEKLGARQWYLTQVKVGVKWFSLSKRRESKPNALWKSNVTGTHLCTMWFLLQFIAICHNDGCIYCNDSSSVQLPPCPPIDSIITLVTVWRITGKIIRTTIMLITYARV